jgi:hypothetical protein
MNPLDQANYARFSIKIIRNSSGFGYEFSVKDCETKEKADELAQFAIDLVKEAIVKANGEIELPSVKK